MPKIEKFNFVDLFAGIGGFHAALSGMGGNCILASEIDVDAAKIYEDNWGVAPVGDIREFATKKKVNLPSKDQKISVLTAGFPCQPFSKSGKQMGMDEERGTLFDHIMFLIEKRTPSVLILENVRNLAGPRHRHEFEYIINRLREAGYRVSETPSVFSPHRIRPTHGGRPQIRERLFITATYAPRQRNVNPDPLILGEHIQVPPDFTWNILDYLNSEEESQSVFGLSDDEMSWLETWEKFLIEINKKSKGRLPGFPLWSDEWKSFSSRKKNERLDGLPQWKKTFLSNNWKFYEEHQFVIDKWRDKSAIDDFPASRRKLEWQAQDEKSIWNCAVHFRPSGIRVKRLTYLPALVAMNQTSVICPIRRKLTPSEAARLQGLPEGFNFGGQPLSKSYKQLGNGVNVGVIWQVLKAHVNRDLELIQRIDPDLALAVEKSSSSPDSLDRISHG